MGWPRRAFGALGLAHAVPGLPQYWHPVVLAARCQRVRARGRARAPARRRGRLCREELGPRLPRPLVVGPGGDVPAIPTSGVAFAGGRLPLPGADVAPTAVVVRLGARRLALVAARSIGRGCRSPTAPGGSRTRGRAIAWRSRATPRARWRTRWTSRVPGERRTADGARQHLAGRIDADRARGSPRALPRRARRSAGLEVNGPSRRRSAKLSGSEATSGSKRPITAHSARRRRAAARSTGSTRAAVHRSAPPSGRAVTQCANSDAHRVRLVPAPRTPRGRRGAGSRGRASRSARTARRRGDVRPRRARRTDTRGTGASNVSSSGRVRDPPRDQAPERARVAQPDLARDPPQALGIAGHRAAALRADARPGRPGVEVRPGAHDHRRHCRQIPAGGAPVRQLAATRDARKVTRRRAAAAAQDGGLLVLPGPLPGLRPLGQPAVLDAGRCARPRCAPARARRARAAHARRRRRHGLHDGGDRRGRRRRAGHDARPEPAPARPRRGQAGAGARREGAGRRRGPALPHRPLRPLRVGGQHRVLARAPAGDRRGLPRAAPRGARRADRPACGPGIRSCARLAETWMLFPAEAEYRDWFAAAGFADVALEALAPDWYRSPRGAVRRRGLRAQAGGRARRRCRSGRCATRRARRPGSPSARASRCASPSDRSRARSSSRSAPRSALRHRLRARSAP